MTREAKQQLADDVTGAAQFIAKSFGQAAEHLDAHPDHDKAERLGRAAWSVCEELRAILLRAEPADEWATLLSLVEDLKDTAHDWIATAQARRAEQYSQG